MEGNSQSRSPLWTRARIAGTAAGIVLAIAATALAAHPKADRRYGGDTSEPRLNGFRAHLAFWVSHDGHHLVHFRFSTFGCFRSTSGGHRAGVNYFLQPYAVHPVATIKVAGDGAFAIRNSRSTYSVPGETTVTSTSVTGAFTRSKVAEGTISIRQRLTGPGLRPRSCARRYAFVARTK